MDKKRQRMRFDFTDPELKKSSIFSKKKESFKSMSTKKKSSSLPKIKKGISFSFDIFKKNKQNKSNNTKLNKIKKTLPKNLSILKKPKQNNLDQIKQKNRDYEIKKVIKNKFSKKDENPEQKLREIFAKLEENRKRYEEEKQKRVLSEEKSNEFLKIFEDIQNKNNNIKEKKEIKTKTDNELQNTTFEDEIIKNFLKSKSKDKKSRLNVVKNIQNSVNNYKNFNIVAKVGEFFTVWFINILFTLASFGAYYPFAKQKIKEYLYNNITLNGSNFEYKLNTKYLLDTSIFLAITAISSFALYYLDMPLIYQIAPISLIIIATPWIIYKNIKSNIDAISYRNVSFRYIGNNLLSFYKLMAIYFGAIFAPTIALVSAGIYFYNNLAYALSAILAIVSILYFLLSFTFLSIKLYNRYQDLIINKTYFGVNRFYFDTSVNINSIFKKFLPFALIAVLMVGSLSFLVYTNFIGLFTIDTSIKYILITLVLFVGGSFFLGALQGYLQNFTLNNTTLKGYSIKSNIKPIKLGTIKFVNSILLIFSLGLAYPYTKLKELKYRLSHTLFECNDCDEFIEGSI